MPLLKSSLRYCRRSTNLHSFQLSSKTAIHSSTTPENAISTKNHVSNFDFPQSMDYTSILLATEELQHLLIPSKVENIVQEDPFNLFVCLKTLNSGNVLL